MVPSLPERDKSPDSSLLGLLNASWGEGKRTTLVELGKGLNLDFQIIFFFCGIWLRVEQLFSKSYLFC